MSDEDTFIGVELERVSKKNPVFGNQDEGLGDNSKSPPFNDDGKDHVDDDRKDDVEVETDFVEDGPLDCGTTGQVVESSSTGTPSVSNIEHITKCATTWSVVGFILSISHTATYAAFASTKDEVYIDFYTWVSKPICFTAMAVSFLLKPRRTGFAYIAFLYFQYAILTLGSEIFILTGLNWDHYEIMESSARCLLYAVVLFVAMRVRSRVARLTDADLSNFLSMSAVKGALVVGLSQLVFLAFSSIQCANEAR